jgi:hypothetical protein
MIRRFDCSENFVMIIFIFAYIGGGNLCPIPTLPTLLIEKSRKKITNVNASALVGKPL